MGTHGELCWLNEGGRAGQWSRRRWWRQGRWIQGLSCREWVVLLKYNSARVGGLAERCRKGRLRHANCDDSNLQRRRNRGRQGRDAAVSRRLAGN